MTRLVADWLAAAPAQRICRVLTDAGHQAWFVGGCVRNALLGEPVADLDVSTDAHPKQVMDLAQAAGLKVVPTGIDHGTVTVVVQSVPFEITTFRRDVATDGRRATVAFADNMVDDARRRDFTMNALYVSADGTIADPLGGLTDLRARRLRFIEDADQRIKEDYLRIMRFFRFHAWYGNAEAGPDADALAACANNVEGLRTLSQERITSELLKLLGAPDPAPSLASFAATGGLALVLPGANAQLLTVLVHIEQSANLPLNPIRRLVALGGEPDSALRLSRKQSRQIAQINDPMPDTEAAYRFGASIAVDRLALAAASENRELDMREIEAAKNAEKQVFPLTASDLMPGLQGAALGAALKTAERRWIDSGFQLTKADLLG